MGDYLVIYCITINPSETVIKSSTDFTSIYNRVKSQKYGLDQLKYAYKGYFGVSAPFSNIVQVNIYLLIVATAAVFCIP